MKASIRGSIMLPVIKRAEPPLPEWKLHAIEIGHAEARRAAASSRAKKPSVQKSVALSRPAIAFSSLVSSVLGLALT